MEYLTGIAGIIIFFIMLVVSVLITRLLGAWMLRINDVINLLQSILAELQKSK